MDQDKTFSVGVSWSEVGVSWSLLGAGRSVLSEARESGDRTEIGRRRRSGLVKLVFIGESSGDPGLSSFFCCFGEAGDDRRRSDARLGRHPLVKGGALGPSLDFTSDLGWLRPELPEFDRTGNEENPFEFSCVWRRDSGDVICIESESGRLRFGILKADISSES